MLKVWKPKIWGVCEEKTYSVFFASKNQYTMQNYDFCLLVSTLFDNLLQGRKQLLKHRIREFLISNHFLMELTWHSSKMFLNYFNSVACPCDFRYYQKQLLEDQLKERRARLQQNKKKEENSRLTDLGYTGGMNTDES